MKIIELGLLDKYMLEPFYDDGYYRIDISSKFKLSGNILERVRDRILKVSNIENVEPLEFPVTKCGWGIITHTLLVVNGYTNKVIRVPSKLDYPIIVTGNGTVTADPGNITISFPLSDGDVSKQVLKD